MKGAIKESQPQALTDWLSKACPNWHPCYPFNDKNVRDSVIQALYKAQRGLCVYCGCKLNLSEPGKTFHIEHFKPQSTYPDLQVDYSNLYLSCGQEDTKGSRSQTCGTYKGNWFEEDQAIDPIYPECTNRFQYTLNGEIKALSSEDVAASTMITKLNLNYAELVRERKELFLELDSKEELVEEDFWNNEEKTAEKYAHIAYYHFNKTLP